jgi:hypothetical protein
VSSPLLLYTNPACLHVCLFTIVTGNICLVGTITNRQAIRPYLTLGCLIRTAEASETFLESSEKQKLRIAMYPPMYFTGVFHAQVALRCC